MRDTLGRFTKGHSPIVGAFGRGSKHTQEAKNKVSLSLLGNRRRWLGDKAGYVAHHIWLVKHFGKANHCEVNPAHIAKRYEWANINHSKSRNRADYIQLCPSCHRLFDMGKLEVHL